MQASDVFAFSVRQKFKILLLLPHPASVQGLKTQNHRFDIITYLQMRFAF